MASLSVRSGTPSLLVNIQLLRFVAAMLVVLYHTAARMPEPQGLVGSIFTAGTAVGFAGVDVFFVISGFIMAFTTMDRSGGQAGNNFARRRIARIYSGYWPVFILTLWAFSVTRSAHVEESNLVASFFLWPQSLNHTLLEVTWTLSFELYFYLLFAVIVWLTNPARRALICAVSLLLVLLFNLWRHFGLDSFGPENLYGLGFYDQFLTAPFIAEFFAGALLAYWLQKKPDGPALAWLLSGVVLFAAAGVINNFQFNGNLEQGFHVVPRVILFGMASVMLVLGLVRLESRDLVAPLRFSLIAGGASYAIYLTHVPVLVMAGYLGIDVWAARQPYLLAVLWYLVLMLAIALTSMVFYRLIERPLHQLFKRVLSIRASNQV